MSSTDEKNPGARPKVPGVPTSPAEPAQAAPDGRGLRPARDDLTAFPVLVSPIDVETGTSSRGGAGDAESGIGMEQLVSSTLRQVLGWTPNVEDTKGFTGALTQSVDLIHSEGHVDFAWKRRTFAVLTDLEGGVTGAQASLYTRAKDVVERALPLLEGLYPLDLDADPEDSSALKALIREHVMSLVAELGRLGGPRVMRVDQQFDLLVGVFPAGTELDADKITGELGTLRQELGLELFEPNADPRRRDLVNTVREEENQTNFRILADYVISLRITWLANRKFFARGCSVQPFFGTQLVHLSRQLAVIAEQVREVQFAFTSVMIGPRERQTLEIFPRSFADATDRLRDVKSDDQMLEILEQEPLMGATSEPIFLEDLLSWVESFAREEGPRLVRDGGKLGVQTAFLLTADKLELLVRGIRCPLQHKRLPPGYFHPRVRASLLELDKQLVALVALAAPIQHSPLQQAAE